MVYIIAFIVIGLIGYLILRPKNKPEVSIQPQQYKALLEVNVAYYRKLDAAGKLRFEKLVDAFLNDINI